MSNVTAIFRKQLNDTLKNKTILIQFILFPILTLIMDHAIKIEGMPNNFFVNLFATMYIGMAPLTSMAAIIAEEKETNTLRVLLMSNVKPYEYLSGIGSYVWSACMAGAAIICIAGSYELQAGLIFMGIMATGILTSLLTGAAIGTWCTTQMMATSLTLPVMMAFSFIPMLSLFNTTIAKIGKFIYSEQIRLMLSEVEDFQFRVESICIIGLNMLTAIVLFTVAYRKCGLE